MINTLQLFLLIFVSVQAVQALANDKGRPSSGISDDHAVASKSPIHVEISTWSFDERAGSSIASPTASPGDFIRYKVVYKNVSNRTIKDISAELPIPSDTKLRNVEHTKKLQASINKLDYYHWPPTRKVRNHKGKLIKQKIPLAEIRSLRWRIPKLKKGKDVEFLVDVQVDR